MTGAAFIERNFESSDGAVAVRWQLPTLEPTGEYKCPVEHRLA